MTFSRRTVVKSGAATFALLAAPSIARSQANVKHADLGR